MFLFVKVSVYVSILSLHHSCLSEGSPCVDKSLTCKNTTFQSFVCPDKELQKTCMKSCGLCYCDPNPCVHGTCTSSIQGYSCSCNDGYTGSLCDRLKPTFPYHNPVWKWTDCSDPATRVVYVKNFDVSPKPIRIPGNISVTLNSNIAHKLLADSHYRLNVTVDKKLLGHYHQVPCKDYVGSCLYDDLCDSMQEYFKNHSCPKIVTDNGLTCGCPVDGISLFMNSLTARLNSISPQFYFIANGNFRVRAELMHGYSMIGCLLVEWTISTPCTGFLCGR